MNIAEKFRQATHGITARTTGRAALLLSAAALTAATAIPALADENSLFSNFIVCNNNASRCTMGLGFGSNSILGKATSHYLPTARVRTDPRDPLYGQITETRPYLPNRFDCILFIAPGPCGSNIPPGPYTNTQVVYGAYKLEPVSGTELVEFESKKNNTTYVTALKSDKSGYVLPVVRRPDGLFKYTDDHGRLQINCPEETTVVYDKSLLGNNGQPSGNAVACRRLPPPGQVALPSEMANGPR